LLLLVGQRVLDESHHETRGFEVEARGRQVDGAAFAEYLQGTSALGFDVASPEQGVGHVRVEGLGWVLAQQVLHGPTIGQMVFVTEMKVVFVDANLYGRTAAVVFMGQRAKQGLA